MLRSVLCCVESCGYSHFDVSYNLFHKLLFVSQVIELFMVKLVKFDMRNIVLCFDIRIAVF